MGQTLPDWMLEKAATEAAAMDELYLRVMQAPSWDVALPRFQAILKSLHTVVHFAGGEKGLLTWMGFTGHVVDLKVLCHRHLLLVREQLHAEDECIKIDQAACSLIYTGKVDAEVHRAGPDSSMCLQSLLGLASAVDVVKDLPREKLAECSRAAEMSVAKLKKWCKSSLEAEEAVDLFSCFRLPRSRGVAGQEGEGSGGKGGGGGGGGGGEGGGHASGKSAWSSEQWNQWWLLMEANTEDWDSDDYDAWDKTRSEQANAGEVTRTRVLSTCMYCVVAHVLMTTVAGCGVWSLARRIRGLGVRRLG